MSQIAINKSASRPLSDCPGVRGHGNLLQKHLDQVPQACSPYRVHRIYSQCVQCAVTGATLCFLHLPGTSRGTVARSSKLHLRVIVETTSHSFLPCQLGGINLKCVFSRARIFNILFGGCRCAVGENHPVRIRQFNLGDFMGPDWIINWSILDDWQRLRPTYNYIPAVMSPPTADVDVCTLTRIFF